MSRMRRARSSRAGRWGGWWTGRRDDGLFHLFTVRIERSRDAHRSGAITMGVSTSLDTNGIRGMKLTDCHNIDDFRRSEEHTSELQYRMSKAYDAFCLTKNKIYYVHINILHE